MPSALSVFVTSAFVALAASSDAVAEDLAVEELGADDECLAENGGNASACALNALQYKGSKRTDGDAEGEQTPWGCWGCMMGNSPPGYASAAGNTAPLQHYALNCWYACGERSGRCSWCGRGNACCRYMYPGDPPVCKSASFFPVMSFHTCVKPAHPDVATPAPTATSPGSPSAMPGTTSVVGDGYQPQNKALEAPSEAPLLTFYMYRAMGDNDYAPENVNAATLPGIMWYLHNEVVIMTPRKFGITRIVRMKVQSKAAQPLHDIGMNFGVRYAFDSGKCTGPWSCDQQFQKYGYFVGCNNVGDFPTLKWAKKNHYANAIWYSLPGPCSNRVYSQHDQGCVYNHPGGACAGTPTGRGNCTFSAEPAGEIRIDELEGIPNYKYFEMTGGQEYVKSLDTGVNLNFWAGKADPARCAQRVKAAEDLFAAKYGPAEDLATPKCDFWQQQFYKHSPH